MRRLLTTVAPTMFLLLCCAQAFAQQPKVTEEQNHLSPVTVKITFMDDTSRTVLLRGIGESEHFLTHVFAVKTDGGASTRKVWLDSIAAVKGTGAMRTRSSEFTIVLKDGTMVSAQFTSGAFCDHETASSVPNSDCRFLYAYNADDGNQTIDLQKLKSVEFIAPARKDKAANAMYDTWRYSPYTGEKLP
jgi:hypothetical protein